MNSAPPSRFDLLLQYLLLLLSPLLYGASAAALLALTRLFFLLTEARDAKPRARHSSETCSLAVFLGSGTLYRLPEFSVSH